MKKPGKRSFDRSLRVGEEIRHAVSAMIQRAELHSFQTKVPLTVTEVRVSPDLRHANIFVMPLGGKNKDQILKMLRAPDVVREFRMLLADAVKLQFVPNIRFELDSSFDEAEKIERLIRQSEQKRKTNPVSDSESTE